MENIFEDLARSEVVRSYETGLCHVDLVTTQDGVEVYIKEPNRRNPDKKDLSVRAILREIDVLSEYGSLAPEVPIPTMFDHCTEGPYLATENVGNETIHDWLGPLPSVSSIVFASYLMSQAIGKLHQAGIAHRDIHQGNFILTEDSFGNQMAHPIDFSTAGTIDDLAEGKLLQLKTPFYDPRRIPERRAKDRLPYDPFADDVYALGTEMTCSILNLAYDSLRARRGHRKNIINHERVYNPLLIATGPGGLLNNELGMLLLNMVDPELEVRLNIGDVEESLQILWEMVYKDNFQIDN